jgi:hypothetical protein
MRVSFTKCDVEVLKLSHIDQLRYIMLHYVTFRLCYAMFVAVSIRLIFKATIGYWTRCLGLIFANTFYRIKSVVV